MNKLLSIIFFISIAMPVVSEEKKIRLNYGSFAAGCGSVVGDGFGEKLYKNWVERSFDSLENQSQNNSKKKKKIADLKLQAFKAISLRRVIYRISNAILFGCLAGYATNRLIVTK